jgi:hypothetical protein
MIKKRSLPKKTPPPMSQECRPSADEFPMNADTRVWTPDRSTGEEAYSIAILIEEQKETCRKTFKVQMFATDILVDHKTNIRRFTPAATSAINLIQTDVERPLSHEEKMMGICP